MRPTVLRFRRRRTERSEEVRRPQALVSPACVSLGFPTLQFLCLPEDNWQKPILTPFIHLGAGERSAGAVSPATSTLPLGNSVAVWRKRAVFSDATIVWIGAALAGWGRETPTSSTITDARHQGRVRRGEAER